MICIYYLLYKIKTSHILWIVKVDDNIYNLKNHIKNVNSSFEKYYIIERKINASNYDEAGVSERIISNEEYELLLKRTQFVKFIPNKHDIIITETNYT